MPNPFNPKDPPQPPKCLGGVWYHEGQPLLKNDSWYQRELAKRRAEKDAFWHEIHERVAAARAKEKAAEDAAKEAAKRAYFAEVRDAGNAARRDAGLREWRENELPWEKPPQSPQEAAQEAAAPPVNGRPQEAAAQRPSTWRPSKNTRPRKTKAERAAELERESTRNEWDRQELEWLKKHPHLWGIPDLSQNNFKLTQRYYVTSVMFDDARKQNAIIERAVFDCNRIINQQFPALEFSEMEYINGGHAIDLNYYRTPKPKGRKRNK